MKTVFKGKKIAGIVGILPETVAFFDDEVDNYSFPPKNTLRLKKIMGYGSHRLSKEGSYTSDFAVFAMNYILMKGYINKDEIGAVVVVTVSPDYFLPHVSNILHGECGLSENVICLDIAQGCCGYLVGIMQACMFLEHMKEKKVVVINADVLSKKVSHKDRNDFPLIGDAASITVIENNAAAEDIHFIMHMDGSRREALKVPAGGFRLLNSAETAKMKDVGDGNMRAMDHLHMDGAAVFNFVQSEVPPLIDEILEYSNRKRDEIEYYLFHQPNQFMLQKLAEKLEIPIEKIFMNVVGKYGNPSGVSIPIVVTDNLSNQLTQKTFHCCLSAFGSGLAWGAAVLKLGDMKFCELITSEL